MCQIIISSILCEDSIIIIIIDWTATVIGDCHWYSYI